MFPVEDRARPALDHVPFTGEFNLEIVQARGLPPRKNETRDDCIHLNDTLQVTLGIAGVLLAGLISGSAVWPMKLMRRYRFEHWWFLGMLLALVIFPWLVAALFCPKLIVSLAAVPRETILKANAWSLGWGVAAALCGLCYVRLGVGLTTAILSGIGIGIGVTLPLICKGSGVFQNAPSVISPAGLMVVGGAVLAMTGSVFASMAGHGRQQERGGRSPESGRVALWLGLAGLAGVLTCGFSFSFVYGQGPIISALKVHGAGDIPATFAVWGVALAGGSMIVLGHAAWLLTKNKSWSVFLESPKEFLLALLIGVNTVVSIALLGSSMLRLGALGGSVGTGLQQIGWLLGGQAVGFLSGEWRGVHGRPRKQILTAIGLLMTAVVFLACGNSWK